MGVKEKVRQVLLRDGGATKVGPPGQQIKHHREDQWQFTYWTMPAHCFVTQLMLKWKKVQGCEYLPSGTTYEVGQRTEAWMDVKAP